MGEAGWQQCMCYKCKASGDEGAGNVSAEIGGASFLMPGAIPVAGIQHIVNNMCADVHESMSHWSAFFADLKVLEAFLRMEERRLRYVWTCLRGTPSAALEERFKRFRGSLYQARWHEVLQFLRAVSPLLPILARTWDETKYIRGVDFQNASRPRQAEVQARQEDGMGLHNFSPARLSTILRSSLFHAYADMALKLEEIPEALASRCELCPCHGPLLGRLSLHRRQQFLEQHFGEHLGVCPMAGKLLPELICGELEDVCSELGALSESSIILAPSRGDAPLTQREWSLLLADFQHGRAAMVTFVRLKTDYFRRLPWMLCALAHLDESIARAFAARCRTAWLRDPRREAHHRVTWRWMREGSNLRACLDRFIDGEHLQNLPAEFRMSVAMLRFPPCVETTIEAKHARVAVAKRAHHIGPVRVSLANRLGMFDRSVRKGQIDCAELLRLFAQARSLQRVPGLLGLDGHPDLQFGNARPASLRVALAKVVYHCDMVNMFKNSGAEARANQAGKRRAAVAEAKLLAVGRPRKARDFDTVVRHAMQSHLLCMHEAVPARMYSARRSCLELAPFAHMLEQPATKASQAAGDLPTGDDLPCDVECNPKADESDIVHFQITLKNPKDKQVVRVAPGAGGRLPSGAIVTLHRQLCETAPLEEKSMLVAPMCSEAFDLAPAEFILTELAGTVEDARWGFVKWTASRVHWTLRSPDGLGDRLEEASQLIGQMVSAGALHGTASSLGFTPTPAQEEVLSALAERGIVEPVPSSDTRPVVG